MPMPMLIEEFVELVTPLEEGKAAPFYHGYILADRESHAPKVRFDRLLVAITFLREQGYIETFQKRRGPMEYTYFARKKKKWPYQMMLAIAKEMDTKIKLDGWYLEAKAGQLSRK